MAMLGSEPLGLYFPDTAEMPEGSWHFKLRTILYDFLVLAFGDVATIGSDQFIYWDPTNPRICLSPDGFVRFGTKNSHFRSWKVWERGVPQVAVEIISGSELELSWEVKLERYRQLGVSELVWFDPEVPELPLRIWDLVDGDLRERRLLQPLAHSRYLDGYWLPVADSNGGLTLRLSRDEHGLSLFPTEAEYNAQRFQIEAEARRVEAEAHRVEAEARRVEAEAHRVEAEAHRAAERRILELEAELKRRS